MKLLALIVAFQTAFLFSIASSPTAGEAAASLGPAAAAPADDEPRIVHHEQEIVVRR